MKVQVLLIYLLFTSLLLAQDNFDIIYLADGKYAQDPNWLFAIQSDWGATAINLRIYRSAVDKGKYYSWNNANYGVDKPIEKILTTTNLNLYIRVNLTMHLTSELIKFYNYTDKDFHMMRNGIPFKNYHAKAKNKILNLTSKDAREDLLEFFKLTVVRINNLVNELECKKKVEKDEYHNRIKLIVPTFSFADESEYPFSTDDGNGNKINNILTGYSSSELDAFMKFLEDKYTTVKKLNSIWNTNYNTKLGFKKNNVDINIFDWDGIKTSHNNIIGRKDFLDFRRDELENFIKACGEVVRDNSDYKFGIQLGSIYDDRIEFRGYYDPTPLFKHIDCAITGDILEFYPNYNFSFDYLRSLCDYGSYIRGHKINFITETNWPNYGDGKYPSELLVHYWEKQLSSSYKRGCSGLSLSHWGTIGEKSVAEDIALRTYNIDPTNILNDSSYSYWGKSILPQYSEYKITKINYSEAVHLSCEQNLYSRQSMGNEYHHRHNERETVEINGWKMYIFPLYKLTTPLGKCTGFIKRNEYYRENGQFVTNYMIENDPEYLFTHFDALHFNGTSFFITEKAYSYLLNISLSENCSFKLENDSWYFYNGKWKSAVPLGKKNEYNKNRSFLQLEDFVD